MKKTYLLFCGLISAINASSQLDTVTYFNQVIKDIQVFDNNLHIGGNFTQNEGSTCYWSAYYNGSSVTRHTNLIGGSGVRGLEVFDNQLYNVGAMDFGGTVGVGVWDGYSWDDAGSTNYSHSTIYADVNDLYIESDNGLIRKKTASGSWTLFYDFAGVGGIGSIIRYGANLIFGGSFTSVNGVSASNIAQWNGSNWSALGTGLNGSVGAMEVYNNELYVTGTFTLAGSTAVTNIAKWNGTSWADVGAGLAGASFGNGISDMIVHDNKLFVVGRFDLIGGQVADDIAWWNGSTWTGVNYPHPELSLTCIEVFNNEIYIGSFDFSKSRLYRYMGGVGLTENEMKNSVEIYPNPSKGIYTIKLPKNQSSVQFKVVNNVGQEILSGEGVIVDLTNQEAGIYYCNIFNNSGYSVIKLIKE